MFIRKTRTLNEIFFPRIVFIIATFSGEIACKHYRSKRYQKPNVGQFYALMRPVVILGNCFGLMPMNNFYCKEPQMLQYTWKSWNFSYSILIQAAIFILFATSFYKQAIHKVEFEKFCKILVF